MDEDQDRGASPDGTDSGAVGHAPHGCLQRKGGAKGMCPGMPCIYPNCKTDENISGALAQLAEAGGLKPLQVSVQIRGAPLMARFPLVIIEWEDSVQPASSWCWLEHFQPSEPVSIKSVGWLVSDGEVKALAPNIGSVAGEDEQASGIIHIPARCVTSVTELLKELYPDA